MMKYPDLDNKGFAKIIVEDTIRSAHTDHRLAKDATVQDCLDALRGPQAASLVQAMIAEYTPTGKEVKSGEVAQMDGRLVGRTLNIHARSLLEQLDTQLQQYLNLSEAERIQLVAQLVGQEEQQDVFFRSIASSGRRQ